MRSIVVNEPSISNVICNFIWPGFKPIKQIFRESGRLVHYIVELEPREFGVECPHCGAKCTKVHSHQIREAMDYPLFPDGTTLLRMHTRRYRCPHCGHTCTDRPSFIEPKAKVTNNLILHVQRLMRTLSSNIKEISRLTGLSYPTIKKINKMQLEYCYGNISFQGVKHIAIDEFSVFKNRRFATVVIDNDTCKVLWVGLGKSQAAVQPFFDLLKEQGVAENIRCVACDQNAAYPSMVRDNLPNAVIVYDLFHVLANWRRDVLAEAKKFVQEQTIQRIRDEYAQRETNPIPLSEAVRKAKKELSGTDWAMITPLEHLNENKRKQQEKLLDTVVKDNALLAALAPLSEALRNLWKDKTREGALKKLKTIRSLLLAISRKFNFKPARRFARMLLRRYEGIVDAGRFGYTTNRLEGVNNKIKVIKRIGYGYRDLDYFFLLIKQALPGKVENPLLVGLGDAAIINGQIWRCAQSSI